MTPAELRIFLESEARKPFAGWDFSYLNHRIVNEPMDWSYPSIVLGLLRGNHTPRSLLDMGTGGGEFFATLHPFPPFTCVTEAYAPNVPIARAHLEPLGVQVFQIDEDDPMLPFADEQFDLIINRHEYYDPEEVFRILSPGGVFVTQQVGGRNDIELIERLGGSREDGAAFNVVSAEAELAAAGFVIKDAKETIAKTRVFDVGAVVYYFLALPWEIPGFSVASHFNALLALHEEIQARGWIETSMHRFLVVARKEITNTQ